MTEGGVRRLIFKDSTLREGLDVPGVELDLPRKRAFLEKLSELGVPEAEIVAPGHFETDLTAVKDMALSDLPLVSSGLIYGNRPECTSQIKQAGGILGRVDILMPLAPQRPPSTLKEKIALLKTALKEAGGHMENIGAGFPHATQVEPEVLLEICEEAVSAGAERITLYDTNGAGDPWQITDLVEAVRKMFDVEICFHAHNDLGMATANSLAAVRAGASCLDVTINGLGDRAGNASLEQLAVALFMQGVRHGVRLELLHGLCRWVAETTGVPVEKLAPIVGDFVFCHKSPSHLSVPELFEAYDPRLVGMRRSICKTS